MAEVWRKLPNGRLEYVPTDDGLFEKWMDEQNEHWWGFNTWQIEEMRECWETARAAYSREVD